MNWLDALMRPDLRSLPADRSARADSAAAVALDANESPWPPFGKLAADDTYNRYPDPQPPALRQRLAEVFGLDAGQILLGRGSGEGIDALLRLFCRANQDQILICPPTFAMYEAAARLQGAETLTAPLGPGGQLDLPAILRTCTPRTKLIFIPSPNAPMGHLMSEADMTGLCAARAGQSLVVIDEAYIEFSDRPAGMLPYLKDHPNLVILRTLSNAHALAGERVGCVIGAPDLVQCLARILAPYPLPRSSIRAAIDALSPNGLVHSREHRRLIVSERARMSMLLPQSKLVEHVFPSSANFLLIRTADSAAFMEHLRRYGIRARCCDGDIPNTVRLSIGTPEENILVLACLGIEQAQPAAELTPRLFSVRRATRETAIDVTVNLDSPHFREIETGIGFFDHMLAQLAAHGGFGLALRCAGDLHIDQHHSVEDCALALGEALKAALGDKRGIARFGFTAPLDEALAEVVVDLSGRPYFVFTGTLPLPSVGGLSSDMVPHFFGSLSTALNAAIYVKVTGENTHHMVEACFKAAGRALRQAFRREGGDIPSTKGVV